MAIHCDNYSPRSYPPYRGFQTRYLIMRYKFVSPLQRPIQLADIERIPSCILDTSKDISCSYMLSMHSDVKSNLQIHLVFHQMYAPWIWNALGMVREACSWKTRSQILSTPQEKGIKAVTRFERWCGSVRDVHTSAIEKTLPPIDVVMVWHTYLMWMKSYQVCLLIFLFSWYAEDTMCVLMLSPLPHYTEYLTAHLTSTYFLLRMSFDYWCYDLIHFILSYAFF